MASKQEAWRVRSRLLSMIAIDQQDAAKKYRNTSAWWNPERAAYYDKVHKRYAHLTLIGRGIPDSNADELTALFLAYADYKHCLAEHWSAKTPMKERACYTTELLKFCTPERIAAGLDQ
jgi:hypothetical protein